MTMINLYPVIAEKLHIPVGKEFKLKPKRGGVYPAQYRFSADDLEYRGFTPSQQAAMDELQRQAGYSVVFNTK
ncbi:hypothetical protein [Phascolarctobacterium succinatutens]|uniref:hypothetical protein n=1 Tax=Phascolarctobacterium succinatutens TaxID=626940 RepID=UPI0023F41DB0|nr:hypothetical protein [Phascolarctobacterium succinatutens]